MPFQVHQERAVGMAAPEHPVLHAEHSGFGNWLGWITGERAKQGIGPEADRQPGGEARRLHPQRQAEGSDCVVEALSSPLIRRKTARERLAERVPGTSSRSQ